jgi:hypothetical protein
MPNEKDEAQVYPPTMAENLLSADGKLDLYKLDPRFPPGDPRRYGAQPDQPKDQR